MKKIKILSDVVTSRGIFKTGDAPELEDYEADACIKQGKAELVSAGPHDATTPKPVMPGGSPAPPKKF